MDEQILRTAVAMGRGMEEVAERVAPARERELIRRALDLPSRKKLLLVRRLWRDERVQAITRLPLVVGAAYTVLPVRVLPPALAFLRPWEKLVGLGVLLWLVVRITPEDVLREHLDALERPGVIGRVLRR